MSKPRLGTFGVLLGALALSGCMHKAYVAHCDEPRASFMSDVTLVLMPHEYAGKKGGLSTGASGLARLTQLQMLRAGLEYDSFAVTLLLPARKSESVCDPLDVEDKLTGRKVNPGSVQILSESQDLVIWWGRVYEDAGAIYVQNSWKVVDRSPRTFVHQKRVPGSGEMFRFEGQLPVRAVSFPPRRLDPAQLAAMQAQLSRAAEFRDAPGPWGSRVSGSLIEEAPASFTLRPVQGLGKGWAEVQRPDGRVGYLKLSDELTELTAVLPELHFLQGLVGVLQLRHPQISIDRESRVALVEQAFARFRAAEKGPGAEQAMLASRLLQGYVELAYGAQRGNAAMVRSAEEQFAAVAKDLPLSPEVKALSAVARIVSCCAPSVSEKEQTDIEQMLIRAIVADPTNTMTATNLENYYEFLRASRFQGPFDDATVRTKQRQLRAFREAASAGK